MAGRARSGNRTLQLEGRCRCRYLKHQSNFWQDLQDSEQSSGNPGQQFRFCKSLRYTLNLDKEANALEKAVQDVLDEGLRTRDIISKGKKEISTSQMGDAIISKLQ